MALEATHIRFALDLELKLGIKDRCAYLAGAVYPDSCYVTGIEKALTHPSGYRENPDFLKDDFSRGWFTHLLCDDIQYQVIQKGFPDLGHSLPGEHGMAWLERTAIKVLQDRHDAQCFGLDRYMHCLDQVYAPNAEDESLLKKYHQALQNLYREPKKLQQLDVYEEFFAMFGLGAEIGAGILFERARAYEETSREKISGLYGEVIREAQDIVVRIL